ncbi:unnamed protein product [Caenorhabditis sp. 36 PRJEB53466]|nr:unnamed protein product [Caenorhabditis sp. 36 PRJEB53466]
MPRNQTLCRYFANGICSKGAACQFAHDEERRSEEICQFYLVGKCSYGQSCRFIHAKPQQSTASTSSEPQPPAPAQNATRVRPIQLKTPTFNANAVEFVPSWKKPERAAPLSYASAAAAGASSSSASSSSLSEADQLRKLANQSLCPYYEKSGECYRRETDCAFAHGDHCDMCGEWSLHPHNEEKRKLHQTECLNAHTQEMERAFMVQKTETKTCGICMENIFEKNLRFGILNGCQHCFCLSCIREWRSRDQHTADLATKTVRSCPECRQHSDYVIPSVFWVETGVEKNLLIEMYKENTKGKVCKYYVKPSSRGNCPFGNKCFYKHQLPDGSIDPGEDPHVSRRRNRLVDFIFDNDDDDDDDISYFDESDDDRVGHPDERDPEFQAMMREMMLGTEAGNLLRSVTELIRGFQGFGPMSFSRAPAVPAEPADAPAEPENQQPPPSP